jgi:hypothetical protein
MMKLERKPLRSDRLDLAKRTIAAGSMRLRICEPSGSAFSFDSSDLKEHSPIRCVGDIKCEFQHWPVCLCVSLRKENGCLCATERTDHECCNYRRYDKRKDGELSIHGERSSPPGSYGFAKEADKCLSSVTGVCRPIRRMRGVRRAWSSMKGNQTPMNKIVHYLGLDVHKEPWGAAARKIPSSRIQIPDKFQKLGGASSESPTLSLRAGRSSPATMEVGLVELVPPI